MNVSGLAIRLDSLLVWQTADLSAFELEATWDSPLNISHRSKPTTHFSLYIMLPIK